MGNVVLVNELFHLCMRCIYRPKVQLKNVSHEKRNYFYELKHHCFF